MYGWKGDIFYLTAMMKIGMLEIYTKYIIRCCNQIIYGSIILLKVISRLQIGHYKLQTIC